VTASPWPGASPLTHPPAPLSRGPAVPTDVALAQAGDGRAFERLYREHVTRVHTLVRRMVPDQDAEELTQARRTLIDAGLILYKHPLYQVLALPARSTPRRRPPPPEPSPPRGGGFLSFREFFERFGAKPLQPPEAP